MLLPTGSPASVAVTPAQGRQGLVLPFPIVKERPAFPPELVQKYPRRMAIAYAVVNIAGNMEQISVKDSPNPQLNEHVLAALAKWYFRPARLNGEPVAVKVLMGIPLW